MAEFRFEMWATHRDTDPYYYTNWDRKKKITVVAPNQDAAMLRASAALGSPGTHRYWVFRTISVTDNLVPEGGPNG